MGISDRERHVQHAGECSGQFGLTAAGWTKQQDVGLRQLNLLGLRVLASTGLNSLVVVVHRNGELLLRLVLADHVLVKERMDLAWPRQLVEPNFAGIGEFLFDDLVTQLDALVADIHTWTSDELLDLLLRLPAEGTLQQVSPVSELCHDLILVSLRRSL
jgi:hypothetical protein